ncbi:hypothetical protein GCM10023191_009170 [Actinoallomurus oryzae]|uniref:Mutator family transposase n=1 Tax=Actinoallomurus oryzae TaxID=502180 RepID=A0ABP8PEV0_9ACTN
MQTCIVHLLRNDFRYAARQDRDKIARALKPVYTAPTAAAAMERWLEFAEQWGTKYPAILRLWENAWAELVPFLQFDPEIRKVVCSTNAIESVNARIGPRPLPQRTSRAQVRLPGGHEPGPTGKGRKRWITRWKAALNAFEITFEGRLTAAQN